MSSRKPCWLAIAMLFIFAAPTSAELLLSEDWEAESAGDQIDQLEQWNPQDGTGAIMLHEGNKFLRLDNPAPGNFSWVTSKDEFSFAGGNIVSLTADITLRGAADADAPARLGIRRAVEPNNRYLVDLYPDRVELQALGAGQAGLLGSVALPVGVDQQHTVLLTANHAGTSIDFEVFLDGGFLFSATDLTPFLSQSVDDRFLVQLAVRQPMLAHFDNIHFNQVRELPSICVYSFYNNSSWDDGDELANAADDGAIATDKVALLPGVTATLANYTSYDKGINGLMIDVQDLPGTPTLNDFLFRWGNDSQPYGNDLNSPDDDWPWAPDPILITTRPGAGQDGADRVMLIWEDGAIRNCWLQVTVLATDVTGLAENRVFYVGNAVGETGDSTTDALVNATDEIGARNHPHSPFNPALIDDPYDFNRDTLVNATDQLIARNHRTSPFTALKLITPPLEAQ